MADASQPTPPCGNGDEWFITPFVRSQSHLYRYIACLVPRRADAEDLLQKTSLTAWQERHRVDRSRDLFPWLCGIARNHVRHYYRSQQRSKVVIDLELVEQMAERLVDADEFLHHRQQALSSCLDKLAPEDRRFLQRFYGQDQTVKQFASILERTVASIYKRLQRLRAALYDCVSETLAREVG